MIRRYLDHNATTPLGPAARAGMRALLDGDRLGNPSSQHGRGREARRALEEARAAVAALVAAPAERLIFTSGGSEAIALGVVGLARGRRAADPARTRVLVGASEHPSVLGAAQLLAREGFAVESLAVGAAGELELEAALAQLDARTALVCLQRANHETGVLQPVRELAVAAREAGARTFCDAVQAAGKIPVEADALGASAISLSAHKLYGPPGAGALVLESGIEVEPLLPLGHQERGRRPGTEPLLSIVGFGAAARESAATLEAEAARISMLRARLEEGLVATGAQIFGAACARVPNTTLCAWPGVSGQLAMIALDLAGFEVSTGAACSSGSMRPSAVLLAAGHPAELALRALRLSLGRGSSTDDVDAICAALPSIIARIRAAG